LRPRRQSACIAPAPRLERSRDAAARPLARSPQARAWSTTGTSSMRCQVRPIAPPRVRRGPRLPRRARAPRQRIISTVSKAKPGRLVLEAWTKLAIRVRAGRTCRALA
jgi:hypothetical protein